MVRTVEKGYLVVNNFVTSENAIFCRLFDSVENWLDIFFWNGTAHRLINKSFSVLKVCSCWHWLDVDNAVTVLTFTTTLTNEFALSVSRLFDGFFICNLWRANVCLHFKLSKKSVNNDFKVKFAHTSDDGLTRFLVGVGFESWVLFSKFHKCKHHFFLHKFGFRLDCNANNWVWEVHTL